MLLPVDMRDWLPADHLVWFVIDTVTALDTTGLERHRRLGGAGTVGYDPVMLLGLLVYAYCGGVRSSRRVEALCHTDVAFRVLCAQDVPDHARIARFRAHCQDEFAGLFAQVLLVAAKVGLARFATIAIDGTKIPANASIDANRGADWLTAQVQEMITEAAQVDQAEDAGQGRAGDRVPAELVDRSVRAERIRQAAAQLVERTQRERDASGQQLASAKARRERAEAGESVIGRIPAGPHRLAEARAHLAREIARQQAILDRRAAIITSGKKPMGAPPLPVERHSHVIRARRAVEAAIAAEQAGQADAAKAGRQLPFRTTAAATSRTCGTRPAPSWGSHRRRPGRTGHRPTARSSGSTAPWPTAGRSRSSTTPNQHASPPSRHGSTNTITTGPTQQSAKPHPSPGWTTWLDITTRCPRRWPRATGPRACPLQSGRHAGRQTRLAAPDRRAPTHAAVRSAGGFAPTSRRTPGPPGDTGTTTTARQRTPQRLSISATSRCW